jgi:hypothetical protein
MVIELDDASFERFRETEPNLSSEVEGLLKAANRPSSIAFAPYRMGSAFLGARV